MPKNYSTPAAAAAAPASAPAAGPAAVSAAAPAAATAAAPETSTNKKGASALKTVLAKRREKSQPSIRKKTDFDPHSAEIPINPIPSPPHWALKNPLPPLWSPLQSGKNEDELNASEIKSGIALKRVYNVEKAEVANRDFTKKGKNDKSKELDQKKHIQVDKTEKIREQIKKMQKLKESPILKVSNASDPQIITNQEKLTPQQKLEEKLRKRTTAEKALNDRRAVSQPAFTKPQLQPPPQPSPSDQKKNIENRITTKVWQILSRDIFLLDHDKFNSQIQATNSETKQYIINVIKKCNNKEIKRLNRPKLTQTSKENSFGNRYRAKKSAMKIAVRRRVWSLAKASMKRSKHWRQFLAENHIIVENINIDKFDLSLIDLEALGIQNKVLKRTVTWLFS